MGPPPHAPPGPSGASAEPVRLVSRVAGEQVDGPSVAWGRATALAVAAVGAEGGSNRPDARAAEWGEPTTSARSKSPWRRRGWPVDSRNRSGGPFSGPWRSGARTGSLESCSSMAAAVLRACRMLGCQERMMFWNMYMFGDMHVFRGT